ncbi:hypothetical protein [Marasmitruncus massiliensis]|uniref:hypothetical protein n=1 Tax=Marasmitruncus massiliensis TaxID=1944642 RepID=UPI000C7C6292|nr:hypothetical protein [Marasmitruncus massiliensis]
MGKNIVAGDYKGGEIKLSLTGKKIVLIKNGLLGNTKIELNKNTVESINVIDSNTDLVLVFGLKITKVEIKFKNGKRCLANVDQAIYDQLLNLIF